jgi:hypothetical protein
MEKTTAGVAAETGSIAARVMSRIGRTIVFFLSAGFLCPNVWVEGMNLSRIQGETEGDLYKNKKKK